MSHLNMKTRLELVAETLDDEVKIEGALRADDLILAVKSIFMKLDVLEKSLMAHGQECATYIKDLNRAIRGTVDDLELTHLKK